MIDTNVIQDGAITLDDSDKVHICWQDNRTGHYNIFYRRSASITSADEIFLELYE